MTRRARRYYALRIAEDVGPLCFGLVLFLGVLLNCGCEKPLSPSPFTDYRQQKPGLVHKITPQDLPRPFLSRSADNHAKVIPRPGNGRPLVPPGFRVDLYASGLENPRQIRTAPNGDLFVAESKANRIDIFHGPDNHDAPGRAKTFAIGLNKPFGMTFYPPGPNPSYLYVANTDSVVRFAYKNGDLHARGTPQVIVPDLPGGGSLAGGGHWTRDIVFLVDGTKMYISVGSLSNHDDADKDLKEYHRATNLEANPDGTALRVFAWGIRNAVGIAVDPATGELWASVNERDGIGDNLPPDYITHVEQNGFYGWPWFYIGPNPDPALKGRHPELASKVIVPDVLIEPHNASLGMTFYDGQQFPPEYHGDIFAAEHGSWNRSVRTGYEVIRVPLKEGRATGAYEDFLTGFVTRKGQVWGRPVGVAVAADGSLMVTDDASGSVWRISFVGK